MNNLRAQGTIEYLVILAIIVVISLVVVALMANSTAPAQGVSATTSQISAATNPISITDAIVSEDGNYYFKLKNNTGQNVTIKSINIGEETANPERKIFMSGEMGFVIRADIVCREGEIVVNEINITYLTSNGILKTQTYPLPINFDCANYGLPGGYVDEDGGVIDGEGEQIVFSCVGKVPDNSTICTNDNEGLTENVTRTLVAACTSATKCEYVCSPGKLFFNGACVSDGVNLISTCDDLQNMQSDLSGNYLLANNIDCTGTTTWNGSLGFVPVGGPCSNGYIIEGTEFSGVFDGGNKTISGLTIHRKDGSEGLFGSVSGTVKNVVLSDINYSTGGASGGLAGCLKEGGLIDNVHSSGTMIHNFMTVKRGGGLVGISFGDIYNSGTDIDITAQYYNYSADSLGGLVGSMWNGTIDNCYSHGDIDIGPEYVAGGTALNGIGGLVGKATISRSELGYSGTISNSYATGNITGYKYVGGLVGSNQGDKLNPAGTEPAESGATIYQSYATGKVTGSLGLGGLLGYNDANIIQSFATGDVNSVVTNTGTHTNVGGLIGYNWGIVRDCYATGKTSGYNNVGSLIAHNARSYTLNNQVYTSYSTGDIDWARLDQSGVYNSSGTVGTLGYAYVSGFHWAHTRDTFFDQETTTYTYQPTGNSPYSDSEGTQPYSAYHGAPKTTAEMFTQGTYTNWDFDTVWEWTGSYPRLKWEFE